jgi:hypothetical protein
MGDNIQLIICKEAAMNVQDQTKENLIKELAELRQRFIRLEEKISKQNAEGKQNNDTSISEKVTEKKVWRLPGYWY